MWMYYIKVSYCRTGYIFRLGSISKCMFLGILFIMYVVTNTYTVVHIMEEMKSINAITFVMVYMIFFFRFSSFEWSRSWSLRKWKQSSNNPQFWFWVILACRIRLCLFWLGKYSTGWKFISFQGPFFFSSVLPKNRIKKDSWLY